MSRVRIYSNLALPFAFALILAAFAAPAAMAAEGERVLDPRLSLIGGCSGEEEKLDPIEDPGCPTTPPIGAHPPGKFANPRAVTTDSHGDIYVVSKGSNEEGTEGRIDVFSPQGAYIPVRPLPESDIRVRKPQAIAVDSEGTLYVWSEQNAAKTEAELLRFEPCAGYDPATGQIEYCKPPSTVTLAGPECPEVVECENRTAPGPVSMAIDHENDHLFIHFSVQVAEYGSAAEENEEIRTTHVANSVTGFPGGVTVDSARRRLYAQEGGLGNKTRIGIYDLESVVGAPPEDSYEEIGTIPTSSVPEEEFTTLSLAVDEGTGDIYAYDTEATHLWKFDENGKYLATVAFPFQVLFEMQISIDNGPLSPNGELSEKAGKGRYLYVPSHPKTNPGHIFAFLESTAAQPDVVSASAANVSEDEAELQARINPGNLATTYTFEFKSEGAADWTLAGEGTLPAGNLDAEAAAAARGLAPGTRYRFRVRATNEKGSDEAEGSFATYLNLPVDSGSCPNALLRTGPSALLPDCRAYELVTPPDTNGRAPVGAEYEAGGFTTRQVSPAGDKVPFRVEGGALPAGGSGGLKGDPYLATRTPAGWSTAYIGPSGAEAVSVNEGTSSPDQGYSFWSVSGEGSALLSDVTTYVRYPDGHSELTGRGSLATDPEVRGVLISEGGGHIVFVTGNFASVSTAIRIEPKAAPDGTAAIYDRTADGITHVVSLKPGDVPFGAGEDAVYAGASLDGVGIAFEVNNILYVRYNDERTFEIGEGVEFAGFAEGGGRIFYVEEGNLKAFDVASESVTVFADTAAPVVPVTVSADGSTAYFVSQTAIAEAGKNPAGAKPKANGQNLYRSKEGQIAFVGTVTERDVVGAGGQTDGLGLWVRAIGPPLPGLLGIVPARSTPDGGVFLFKSRARLTGYDPEGNAEIYRYDSAANRLQCLSCNPTGAPAQSDANIQSESREGAVLFSFMVWPESLRADGRRAFFESSEPLVAADSDGKQDVYEWEDQGVESCTQPGGCTYLISSPQSRRNEYLWAVSRSGDDVFFLSSDLLVGADADETPSVYDARVGGGFAEAATGVCEGEGCRPQLTLPPALPSGETPVRGAGDNVKACGKNKRKVKRGGKVRCVKKKHHRRHAKHRRHRAGAKHKGGHR
jgi:hypothetical protein